MKALTLWEPFASCIAFGVKKIETRTYKTNYRGVLLIHAGKRAVDDYGMSLLSLLEKDYKQKITVNRGHIVARVNLVDCVQMTQDYIDKQTPLEKGLGGWYVGNWAWVLDEVVQITPIPATGAQGFWVPNQEIMEVINKL